ncbi:DUF4118 domain-containing protein [Paenarthrobacter sp. DKR-5]|uniref:ATP-binding protein n=1 Tax=Paenarthrobacter sp. DKR-5 TaxID=2835535 RepID=UPI001BDDAEA8|nr:ATP-binding protein [Paenarthrobacter sp. DKR-5]MBT1001158.1 DUF4118 domain-containing protein [Paenarthrobacter sp. DKR-5]
MSEQVVVGLSGGPEGEQLLRRGARILERGGGGHLLAVHVRFTDHPADESPRELESQRQLVVDLGGSYHAVGGDRAAQALLDFARSAGATDLVVGAGRKRLFGGLLAEAPVAWEVARDGGDLDVHLVGAGPARRRPRAAPWGLGARRVLVGLGLAVLLPGLASVLLLSAGQRSFAAGILSYLLAAVVVALVGGFWPALLAALLGSLLLNYYFSDPVGTFNIADPERIFELAVFGAVAVAVALVVGFAARRAKEAAAAGAEAATLSELARGALAQDDTVEGFLDHVRENFQVTGAALFVRGNAADETGEDHAPGHRSAGTWRLEAGTGADLPGTWQEADTSERIDDSTVLALSGRPLAASDRRLLAAFGAHLLAVRQRLQLRRSREDNVRLSEGNKMRTAILRAVSHDLRTPLAGIKLAVASLRQPGVRFPPEEERELLATIEDYSDRLDALVANLLDLSRLNSDVVSPLLVPVRWPEVLPQALRGLPAGISIDVAGAAPVRADPGMLERVVANVAENAVKYAGQAAGITVSAREADAGTGRPAAAELLVIDHGPGVPDEELASIVQPFHRLDDGRADGRPGAGTGLGLAVAKGFTEAMGGTLLARPTPGGGLTVVVRLPLAEPEPQRKENE